MFIDRKFAQKQKPQRGDMFGCACKVLASICERQFHDMPLLTELQVSRPIIKL